MKLYTNAKTINNNNPFTAKTVKLKKFTVEKIISLIEREVEKSRKHGNTVYTLGFTPSAEVLKELHARYDMKNIISIFSCKGACKRYEDYAIVLNN